MSVETATKAEDSPAPSKAGWKSILLEVWDRIGRDRVIAVAAGFTFYAILAIFPAITAIVSIYGLFADARTINGMVNALSGVLPGGAVSVITDQVQRIASQGGQTLGTAFLIGLLVSLWSANAGVKAMFDALNVAYETPERRGFLRLNAVSLAFTIIGVIATMAIIAGVVALSAYVDLPGGSPLRWVEWPALVVLVIAGLALLYRFGPDHRHPRLRWITPGSVAAAIVWLAASALFAWYTAHFGSYNATYGALGAAIGFMTWIWISAIVVMVGAEINAAIDRRDAPDR